ncbi:UNVERIFIED_CONTAM: hypothetical protein K2H54_016893 [Gekko kuhli]
MPVQQSWASQFPQTGASGAQVAGILPSLSSLAVNFPCHKLWWCNGAGAKPFLCVKAGEEVWISSSGPPMERKTLCTLVVALLAFGAVVTDGNLFDLQKMIKQVTRKSAITNYVAYGCYCGYKGRGKPLDATDRCCYYHDCCYGGLMAKGCKPKTESYSYTHLSGNISCGSRTQCQREICECDRNFVLCLKKNLGSYRNSYRFYWNIFCRGSPPEC